MKRLWILPAIALLAACGSGENADNSDAAAKKEITAEMLCDSAAAIVLKAKSEADLSKSVALYDEAIAKDENLKRAYIGKVSALKSMDDKGPLLQAMNDAQRFYKNDPFWTLHLGMENELQGNEETAMENYARAAAGFSSAIDTLSNQTIIIRNSYIMNLALSNVLVGEESGSTAVLTEGELQSYKTAEEQFLTMDREALLNLRRN